MSDQNRRTFLRNLGACLALPFLPSLPGAFADERRARAPLRMLFVFAPNGKIMPDWTPTEEGADFTLPYLLEPLESQRERMLVLSGLTLDGARAHGDGPGDHARASAAFLTGAHPRKTGGDDILNGISVDQVAAEKLGEHTRFPSLELGIEGNRRGRCDSGYSCAYVSNISWRSAVQPMAKEVKPRLVFDRLFGDERRLSPEERARRELLRGSVLDLVGEQAHGLARRLGRDDRAKLDEYLHAVRELEARLGQPQEDPGAQAERPGKPGDRAEHIQMMGELLTLAFQTDATRVATLMFGNAGSNKSYPQLGVSDGHHSVSHHRGDEQKIDKVRRIDRFHVEQLAALVERFASVREGDGSMLDNMVIVYGSGIGDGNRHHHHDLPVLVLGGGAGRLASGRHVRFPRDTPLTNLYLTLLDLAGVRVPRFGDSTGPLQGLTV